MTIDIARQRVNCRDFGVREEDVLTVFIDETRNGRAQVFTVPPRSSDPSRRSVRPVNSSTCSVDGNAFDKVLELELAGNLGNDRVSVRIPVRDDLALP